MNSRQRTLDQYFQAAKTKLSAEEPPAPSKPELIKILERGQKIQRRRMIRIHADSASKYAWLRVPASRLNTLFATPLVRFAFAIGFIISLWLVWSIVSPQLTTKPVFVSHSDDMIHKQSATTQTEIPHKGYAMSENNNTISAPPSTMSSRLAFKEIATPNSIDAQNNNKPADPTNQGLVSMSSRRHEESPFPELFANSAEEALIGAEEMLTNTPQQGAESWARIFIYPPSKHSQNMTNTPPKEQLCFRCTSEEETPPTQHLIGMEPASLFRY